MDPFGFVQCVVPIIVQYVRPEEVIIDGTISKVGFFGTDGVDTRPLPTGETTGSSGADAQTATFTGNFGDTEYTVGDIVKILKVYGLLQS